MLQLTITVKDGENLVTTREIELSLDALGTRSAENELGITLGDRLLFPCIRDMVLYAKKQKDVA